MSPTAMKSLSALTVAEFIKCVNGASMDSKPPLVKIKGVKGRLRIKRAASTANQIHVGRGEPVVVHVPGEDDQEDRWYVLGVRWQLAYARANAKTAAQHASHAFDCMAIRASEFETLGATLLAVDNADLRIKCVQALNEAQDLVLRMMIRAINAARDAVADALIDTLQKGLLVDDDESEGADDS